MVEAIDIYNTDEDFVDLRVLAWVNLNQNEELNYVASDEEDSLEDNEWESMMKEALE